MCTVSLAVMAPVSFTQMLYPISFESEHYESEHYVVILF